MTTLITGAMGCIGAWTLYHLLQQSEQNVSITVDEKPLPFPEARDPAPPSCRLFRYL